MAETAIDVCSAKTKKMERCRNRLSVSRAALGLCHVHARADPGCLGTTRKGARCKKKARQTSNFCWMHDDGKIIEKAREPRAKTLLGIRSYPAVTSPLVDVQPRPDPVRVDRSHLQRHCSRDLGYSSLRLTNLDLSDQRYDSVTHADYLPENVQLLNVYVNCAICMENNKSGLLLNCCAKRQSMCFDCIVQYLIDNYLYRKRYNENLNMILDPADPLFKRNILRLTSMGTRCPFCRNSIRFKKYNSLLCKHLCKRQQVHEMRHSGADRDSGAGRDPGADRDPGAGRHYEHLATVERNAV